MNSPAPIMSELVLTARVAHMFYLERLSKIEIADIPQVSRFGSHACWRPLAPPA